MNRIVSPGWAYNFPRGKMVTSHPISAVIPTAAITSPFEEYAAAFIVNEDTKRENSRIVVTTAIKSLFLVMNFDTKLNYIDLLSIGNCQNYLSIFKIDPNRIPSQ